MAGQGIAAAPGARQGAVSREIIHIVPRTRPVVDGIGDYAWHLAQRLRDSAGIGSRFLVADPEWRGPDRLDGFTLQALPARKARVLAEHLRALTREPGRCVCLHYSGYGFEKRGVPWWLRAGMRSWMKTPRGDAPLVTIFHELWASGRPWQTAFYLQRVQRAIAGELSRLSAVSVTSTRRMLEHLAEFGTLRTELIPIPSNLPVPRELGAAARRLPPFTALIFGQDGSRLETVKAHRAFLAELERRGALGSLTIVGKGARTASADVRFLGEFLPVSRLRVAGELEPPEVAARYASADFYLSFYPASLACKSATFMSALACGRAAVVPDGSRAAPLECGKHFLACDGSTAAVGRFFEQAAGGALEAAGCAGRRWYLENADWHVVAKRLAAAIASVAG